MKISVIIPTYKPQTYLDECLESLDKQTFGKDFYEVLIILNGEKEPYATDIQEKLSRYSFYSEFFYTPVAGVSNARNIGLDNARGEYVCFIDDDDYVSPAYLEKLYESASPNVVSLCRPQAFLDETRDYVRYGTTETYDRFSEGDFVSPSKVRKFFNGPCMKLISMSFIQGRRFDIRFKNGEDSLFMFLISDKMKRCRLASPQAIYYRRFRQNSAMTRDRSIKEVLINSLRMIAEYTRIYLSAPNRYSFVFYFYAIRGAVAAVVVRFCR